MLNNRATNNPPSSRNSKYKGECPVDGRRLTKNVQTGSKLNMVYTEAAEWPWKQGSYNYNFFQVILGQEYNSVKVHIGTKRSSSSSCHAASTDIFDPLSPLLPIIHRLRQVFRATSHILT